MLTDKYVFGIFAALVLPTLKWPPSIRPRSQQRSFGALVFPVPLGYQSCVMTRTLCVKRVEERYVIRLLFVKNAKIGRMNSVSCMYVINVHCF